MAETHTHTHAHRDRDNHDWHSKDYVAQWIEKDFTRDEERRPLMQRMLANAPFDRSKPWDVLDVGAGYGFVSEETLKAFPHARIVWQDYSRPMLQKAKDRLGGKIVRYSVSDLTDPNWTKDVGGPFDFAVSAIAIHNLASQDEIFAAYRAIARVLKPGGYFLNCDRFPRGTEPHVNVLKDAGFERVEVLDVKTPVAIMVAGPKR